jgi:hypothetical protein
MASQDKTDLSRQQIASGRGYGYWCMSQNKIESIEEQEGTFKTRECSLAQRRFQNT